MRLIDCELTAMVKKKVNTKKINKKIIKKKKLSVVFMYYYKPVSVVINQ